MLVFQNVGGNFCSVIKAFFPPFEGNDSLKRSLYQEQRNAQLCGLRAFSGVK